MLLFIVKPENHHQTNLKLSLNNDKMCEAERLMKGFVALSWMFCKQVFMAINTSNFGSNILKTTEPSTYGAIALLYPLGL